MGRADRRRGARPLRHALRVRPGEGLWHFQDAYSAAESGDTVRVKAGSYGTQKITTDNSG